MPAHYILATDGSCFYHAADSRGTGGWAAVLSHPAGIRTASGSFPHTTSAAMELQAVLEGLRLIPRGARCDILTDFASLGIWINRIGKVRPPAIAAILRQILPLLGTRRATFTIVHRHPLHARAHRLARATAREAARAAAQPDERAEISA